MELNPRSRQILVFVILLGFFVGLVYFQSYFKGVQGNDKTLFQQKPLALADQVGVGLPIRLKIPKINVDVAIEYGGLTPLGAMDIPKSPEGIMWFALGERPGAVGSSVMAGHYGWKDGKKAVFDNLHILQKGDKVYVEDENGATISFVVKEIRKYDEKADAASVFGSNDGKSHLNLITCGGVWNKVSKSYSQRLVVFTDREIEN